MDKNILLFIESLKCCKTKVEFSNIILQYNKDVHGYLLKKYIQECLEKDCIESMKNLLLCFQKAHNSFVHEFKLTTDNDDYNNPFFAMRSYIEAAIWNWPHSVEMDKILIGYPHI